MSKLRIDAAAEFVGPATLFNVVLCGRAVELGFVIFLLKALRTDVPLASVAVPAVGLDLVSTIRAFASFCLAVLGPLAAVGGTMDITMPFMVWSASHDEKLCSW